VRGYATFGVPVSEVVCDGAEADSSAFLRARFRSSANHEIGLTTMMKPISPYVAQSGAFSHTLPA